MAYKGDVDSLTSSVTSLTDAFSKLGGSAGNMTSNISGLINKFSSFAGSVSDSGGAVEMATSALEGLGPEGEAVAKILQVVAAAVTALVVTLWDFAAAAVQISQEKVALGAVFEALAVGANGAAVDGMALVDSVSELAASLPQAEGRVLAWAKSMMAAGIQGAAMERAVRSVAAAEALMGKQGANAAEALIKRFAMTAEIGGKLKLDRRLLTQMAAAGVSASALASALGVPADKLSTMAIDASKLGDAFQKALAQKGGAALANMANTWSSITGKLADSWEDLFEDMGDAVRPFMSEVHDLFAEFFAGSTAMKPVKSILMSVLTTIFEYATKVVHAVHFGFLLIQVTALKVAIALAPIVNFFRAIYSNALVLKGIVVVLALIATPFILIGIVIAAVVVGVIILGTVFAAVAGAVMAAVSWIVGGIISLGQYLGGLGPAAVDAAGNFIDGLVNGITTGAARVIAAVTGLAQSALSAFGVGIDAHSPSRPMIKFGGYLADGAVVGVERGTPAVAAATASMGRAAIDGATRGGGGAGRGGGSMSVTFGPGSIVIDGAGKSAGQITEEMIALVFERLASTQGLAPT